MATVQSFYYLVDDLMNRIRNESKYLENGMDKNFDDFSIGMDDIDFVKFFLEESANEVFIMLHKPAYEVTADDLVTAGLSSVFLFNQEIPDHVGLYINYLISLPDNFDSNLRSPLDMAIRRYLIDLTFYKWADKVNRLNEKIVFNKNESERKLRSALNLKISKSKIYRYY